MNVLQAVIADDEPAAVSVIQALLKQFAPEIIVAGVARDGVEAVQLIAGLKPDIVFLDVDMPVMNGVQVLEKLAGTDAQTIFTTGSAEYALRALKLKAADYLLKPIDPAEFVLALERVKEQHILRSGAQTKSQPAPARLQLPTQNEIVYLDEADISHITGMGSYCRIYTTAGEKITVSRNIGHMEQKLTPERFFRSHNSHIISLGFVAKYLHRDGYFVEMKNGVLVEVSRRSKEALLAALAALAK